MNPDAPASAGDAVPAAETGEEADRIELLGLPPADMREAVSAFMREHGQPSYRTDQVANWVYDRCAASFGEMTSLPRQLREQASERFSLTSLDLAYVGRSEDGTVKHLWQLEDGERVESVLIPTDDRLTLCLSSQAGCALGCRFCATGHFGFNRHLRTSEIVAQFRNSVRVARDEFGREITNVVYMGMGEPMANLDAVLPSLEALNEGFGVGARRITVSTVGLVPGIRTLAEQPKDYGLAVSLHSPDHELRARIMRIEKRFPLPELLGALKEYQENTGRRVTFEYTMIRGVNDDLELADRLAELCSELTCFVNLIPFNPIPDVDWEPSPPERISAFARRLHRNGVSAAVRTPRGRDIAAACGQLRLQQEGDGDR